MSKFTILFLLFSLNILAQVKAKNQKEKLAQYIGTWFSADNISDAKIGKQPNIKMIVIPKMKKSALQVEVFQNNNRQWKLILVELISYDAQTDQIVALGHNTAGNCFIGKGYFDQNNRWIMDDVDFENKPTLHVSFDFLNANEVVLKGEVPKGKEGGFYVKYIKSEKK